MFDSRHYTGNLPDIFLKGSSGNMDNLRSFFIDEYNSRLDFDEQGKITSLMAELVRDRAGLSGQKQAAGCTANNKKERIVSYRQVTGA